jgi:hypothetical protein
MNRYLIQHAGSIVIMETGDHSKNGANPKSLTSRKNIKNVKKIIYEM